MGIDMAKFSQEKNIEIIKQPLKKLFGRIVFKETMQKLHAAEMR